MVLDTSVLLEIFFKQQHYQWAIEQMNAHAAELRMSTVNLTETLIHLQDKQPSLYPEIESQILQSGIHFIAPDILQSQLTAKARLRFSLNLGDCFAYALAKSENCSLLTIDRDFRVLDIPVIYPK